MMFLAHFPGAKPAWRLGRLSVVQIEGENVPMWFCRTTDERANAHHSLIQKKCAVQQPHLVQKERTPDEQTSFPQVSAVSAFKREPQPRSKLSLSCGPRRKDATTTFCTPRAGTSAHLPIGQRQGARLLDDISACSRRYWSYVFPDVLRTIVDANVHLLERVAHIIMSALSNVCMLPATNRKPMNLIHGQTTDVAQPKSL